jgi:hypothetical protein
MVPGVVLATPTGSTLPDWLWQVLTKMTSIDPGYLQGAKKEVAAEQW